MVKQYSRSALFQRLTRFPSVHRNYQIWQVTANIEDCDKEELKSIADPIRVVIDNEPPLLTCWFTSGDVLPETGSGVLKDPGFEFRITENCGGDVAVVVETFSNEFEDVRSQPMVLQYQRPKTTASANNVVGLYLASTICSTAKNGQCISDPIEKNRRWYTTRVTATDEAGQTNTTECSVEVSPKGNIGPIPGGSNQLFSIDRFSTEGYAPDDSLIF
jgi:hypothetical protein